MQALLLGGVDSADPISGDRTGGAQLGKASHHWRQCWCYLISHPHLPPDSPCVPYSTSTPMAEAKEVTVLYLPPDKNVTGFLASEVVIIFQDDLVCVPHYHSELIPGRRKGDKEVKWWGRGRRKETRGMGDWSQAWGAQGSAHGDLLTGILSKERDQGWVRTGINPGGVSEAALLSFS